MSGLDFETERNSDTFNLEGGGEGGGIFPEEMVNNHGPLERTFGPCDNVV